MSQTRKYSHIPDTDVKLFFDSWKKKDYHLSFFSWTQALNVLELLKFYNIKHDKQCYASWSIPVPFQEYTIHWPDYDNQEFKFGL